MTISEVGVNALTVGALFALLFAGVWTDNRKRR